MAISQKPVIVLVHGAWHRPVHFLPLVTLLQERNYDVDVPSLATAGWQPSVSKASVPEDVEVISKTLDQHLGAGREVVLLCHSYGGLPATAAAVGRTIADRQTGSGGRGGIKAMIYVAAFAPPAPELSLSDLAGLKDQPPHWYSMKDGLAILNENSVKMLYSPDEDILAKAAYDGTVPQSAASFAAPCGHAAREISAPISFFACRDDDIIPFEGQKSMAAAAGAQTIEFASGHSPFFEKTAARELVGIIEEAASGSS